MELFGLGGGGSWGAAPRAKGTPTECSVLRRRCGFGGGVGSVHISHLAR